MPTWPPVKRGRPRKAVRKHEFPEELNVSAEATVSTEAPVKISLIRPPNGEGVSTGALAKRL